MKAILRVNILVMVLSHVFSNTPDTSIRNESIRPRNTTKSSKEFENKGPLFGHKITKLGRKITTLATLNKSTTLENTTSLINSLLFRMNPESFYGAKKDKGETGVSDDDVKWNRIKYFAIIGIWVVVILVLAS